MKRKLHLLKTLLVAVGMCAGSMSAWAQASYNKSYTVGVTATAGGDYFLYNIGAGKFFTGGRGWGTQSAADHAGKIVTLETATNGFKIKSKHFSANGNEKKEGYLANVDNPYADRPTGTDNGDYIFTPVSVDGYTNAYTIKIDDSKYLYYNTDDTNLRLGTYNSDNNYHWILVPKSARDENGDYTYYLQNQGFNRPWENGIWKLGESILGDQADPAQANYSGNRSGGNGDNPCAEVFHLAFDTYQTISESMPNGKYTIYAQAFYRNDGTGAAPVLYANSNTKNLGLLNANSEGTVENMNGASTSFSAGHYVNSVSTIVTDGKLKVGISASQADQWVIFDNFAIEYLGTCVVNDAAAFVNGATMAAGTWYYYDIPYNVSYNITAGSDLSAVGYTTDGDQLTADATSSPFTSPSTLTPGRYYFKSTSAQTLTFTPANEVATAILDCKAYETSTEFATAVDAGTFSSAADVYKFHSAWQITQATNSSSTDYTKAIMNANFGLHNTNGWTISGDPSNDAALDNKYGVVEYGDTWSQFYTGYNGRNVSQIIATLPAGTYRLSATVYSWSGGAPVKLFANGSVSAAENGNDHTPTFDFTVTGEETSIKIGIGGNGQGSGDNTWGTWGYRVKNFTLTKLPSNVSKSISAAGWATYCSPFALDLANATGLEDVYIVTGGENGVLTKTSVKGGTVPAYTGLLLKGAEGTATIPVVATSTIDVTGNKLVGKTAEYSLAANGGYVLMASPSLGFYKNTNAFTVGANTAYLPANFDSTVGAPAFFSLEGNTTGINSVKTAAESTNNEYYNLAGQRVAQPTKGLYIVNGKKVIVK